MKELRQIEAPLLHSYEWIDKNAGSVRIPIERAIDLLAERGLPYRKRGQPSAIPPPPAGSQPAGSAGNGTSTPSSGSQTPAGASAGQPATASPPQ
jgi:hypothetical protein